MGRQQTFNDWSYQKPECLPQQWSGAGGCEDKPLCHSDSLTCENVQNIVTDNTSSTSLNVALTQ